MNSVNAIRRLPQGVLAKLGFDPGHLSVRKLIMKERSRHFQTRSWLAIGLGLGALVSGEVAESASARANLGTSGGIAQVLDYLAPLKFLPRQKGFSVSGKLGFGPDVIRIHPPRDRLVVADRDRIEATGSLARRVRDDRSLGWIVWSRLDRLDPRGAVEKNVKAKQQRIPTVERFQRRQFGFGGAVAPGLYRLTVSFSKSDKALGTFKEYFRVVKARSALSLHVAPAEALPGQTLSLRVKNLGTVSATYSDYPHVFGPEDKEVQYDHGVTPNLRPLLKAGYLSPCINVPLPDGLLAGEYRVTLRAKDRLRAQPVLLTSSFRVGP